MFGAILLLCVALAAAQQPRPCETPEQFEARILTHDFKNGFTQKAKISYDGLNKRVREVEELELGKDREFYDVLYLFQNNREYRVNLKDKKCNTTTLSRPFIPAGVPPGAHYNGQAVVGPVNIPNEHISVIRFEGRSDEGNPMFGTVTTPDCLPVNGGFYSNRTGYVFRQYYDVTIGIPDPTVFDIPMECQ
ncbi:mammalian ependymin-related protein 1-like [Babylonia areolata]|uniref:mammalian ependymin-related protein 1-like n=1 Tax=Babylonia areolata TaxID=304850 RepID=UPI003FD4D38A